MAIFRYEARNTSGELLTGQLEAESVQDAAAALQSRELTVLSIGLVEAEQRGQWAGQPTTDANVPRTPTSAPRRSAGETVERAVLRSHMATIIERGKTIVPALQAYAEEMPSGWQRRELLTVCDVLERSDANEASNALARLPEYWIPLLSAATSSADPGHVLHEFLNESQRTDELRQKWWLTLAYPVVLWGLVIVVMTALSLFVIPEFRQIFYEFGIELPGATLWLLAFAEFLADWGVVIIVALGLICLLAFLSANRVVGVPAFGWLSERFRLPFGRRTSIARFARFTADLLDAGVSVPDALRVAGYAVTHSRVRQAAWRLANDIESYGEFSPRAYQPSLTATVAYALSPTTPDASRARVLRDISDCHAERVRIGLSWTGGIVEPIAICLVGLAVGVTVILLFLPLVRLVNGLSM